MRSEELEVSIGFPAENSEISLGAHRDRMDGDPALQLRVFDASVDCVFLSFTQPQLEAGFRRHLAERFVPIQRASFLAFGIFETIACSWNAISLGKTVYEGTTSILSIFDSQAYTADVVWISFHAIQALCFFTFVGILQCASVSRQRQEQASAVSRGGGGGGGERSEPLLSGRRRGGSPRSWGVFEGMCSCAVNGTWVWQTAISLLWIVYQVVYYRIWHSFGVVGLVSMHAASQSEISKAVTLSEAVGLTTMLVMACASSVGGLRVPYAMSVQLVIFTDVFVESVVESLDLAFWPCFKVAMGCAIFTVFARRAELLQRTEYVQKLRLHKANIDANLEINPFTPDALRRWMSLAPTVASSDLTGDAIRGLRTEAGRDLREMHSDEARGLDGSGISASGGKKHGRVGSSGGGAPSRIRTPKKSSQKILSRDIASMGRWEIPWERLELIRKVGGGGSGQVFCGTYDSQPCAVKQLFSTMVAGDVEEFSREVSILAQLGNHPNILALFGVSKHEAAPDEDDAMVGGGTTPRMRRLPGLYIVTEWVDGGDLEQRLQSWGSAHGIAYPTYYGASLALASAAGAQKDEAETDTGTPTPTQTQTQTLPIAMIVELARQIAAAMAFLHLNHVLHLDLKPANILIATAHARPRRSSSITLAGRGGEETSREDGDYSFADAKALRLVLSDFGLASSGRSSGRRRVKSQDRTTPGGSKGKQRGRRISGTPLFMSPELLDGLGSTSRFAAACKHDVYSFGILLAAIATADRPYGGLSSASHAELEAALAAIADPDVQLRPDRAGVATGGSGSTGSGELAPWTRMMPPRFLRMMRLCWSHNPEERPQFRWIERELKLIASEL